MSAALNALRDAIALINHGSDVSLVCKEVSDFHACGRLTPDVYVGVVDAIAHQSGRPRVQVEAEVRRWVSA